MKIHIWVLVWISAFTSLGYISRSGIAGLYIVTLCLNSLKTTKLFFLKQLQHFQLLHILVTLVVVCLFNFYLSIGYSVASIVVLICIFLMSNDVKYLFMLIDQLYAFLEKYLFKCIAHFLIELSVFLLLNHNSALYILATPLSYWLFANTFSIMWVYFHFLDSVLYDQSCCFLWNLTYLCFLSLVVIWLPYLRNHCLTQGQRFASVFF